MPSVWTNTQLQSSTHIHTRTYIEFLAYNLPFCLKKNRLLGWAQRRLSIQSVRQQIVRTLWTPIQPAIHLSKAPGRNLWVAASIVFLSVDGSVLFPIRINSISMSDTETERKWDKEKDRKRCLQPTGLWLSAPKIIDKINVCSKVFIYRTYTFEL